MEYSYIVRFYHSMPQQETDGNLDQIVGLVEDVQNGSKKVFHNKEELISLLHRDRAHQEKQTDNDELT